MITSLLPERWELARTGVDRETGHPFCEVRHSVLRGSETEASTWKLVNFPGRGWRNVGQHLDHFKGFRRCPERYGVVLSNSRLDLTLLSFAETGHGNAYA